MIDSGLTVILTIVYGSCVIYALALWMLRQILRRTLSLLLSGRRVVGGLVTGTGRPLAAGLRRRPNSRDRRLVC